VESDVRAEEVGYRTPIQELALLFALGFVIVGIAGFIPGLTTHYSDFSFAGHDSGAKLFGVFQTSILLNLVRLFFGVVGIVLSRSRQTARAFLIVGGLAYLVIFLYGLVTSDNSGANFIPLNRADDILHAALGGSMLVFGLLPDEVPAGTTETLAGFLAAAAIFVSAIGVAYRPLRLIPFAILLALISTAIGGRSARLATAATFIGAACFVLGMAFAVVTSHPLW
jgi:preprotein translocase subunit Sss1